MPKNNDARKPRPSGEQDKNPKGKRDNTLTAGKKGDKK
jgi:hypothetical protein